jgi:hypothetical protein
MPGRSPHAAPAPRPNGPHMAAPGRPQHQPSMNNHPGGPSENARPAMNRAPQGGGSRPIEARRNEQGRPFPQQGEPGGHRR